MSGVCGFRVSGGEPKRESPPKKTAGLYGIDTKTQQNKKGAKNLLQKNVPKGF